MAIKRTDDLDKKCLKMFENALKRSTQLNNLVLVEAEKLREKGYSEDEICDVLVKLQKSLIDKEESDLVGEAIEDFVTD